VEKRSNGLAEIEKWVGTIKSSSDKILDRVGVTRRALEKQVEVLRDRIADVQDALGTTAD